MSKLALSAALLVSIFGVLAIAPEAKAENENCQYGIYSSVPSENTRWVVGDGYRFKVPANYRAELSGDGEIRVMDPDTFQFLSCVRRENVFTDGFDYLTVEKTNVKVAEGDWPYNLPNFEWLGQISEIDYRGGGNAGFAQFSHSSEYDNTQVVHAVVNVNGGSAYVQSAIYGDEQREVFNMVSASIESYMK